MMPVHGQEKVDGMKEPEQKTRPPQPDRWNLTAAEIAEILRRTGVEPWRGSPFLRPHGAGTGTPAGLAIEDTPDIRDATTRIGRPDIILGLLHVPPGDPDVTWLYGTSGDRRFAVHRRDGGMWHRIVWPVQGTTLADIMETAVSIHDTAVSDAFALSLDRRGFETLAAMVDFFQEEALRSAMQRRMPSVPRFDVDDLFCCWQRNLRGIDLRWMVQRSKLISPVRLSPDPEGLNAGLRSLVEQGMLAQQGTFFAPTPRFHTACSLLTGCSGFFALSTRRRIQGNDGHDAWDFQHMASLRGIGSLWLLEFTDISKNDFTVKLGDVTAGLLHERVVAGLLPPERLQLPDEEAAEKKPYCQNCGAKLQVPAKFCPNCGTKIVEKTVAAATPEAAPDIPPAAPPSPAAPEAACIPCPKCGSVLAPGKRFCTRCGTPLT
jgi:hypothetical protein